MNVTTQEKKKRTNFQISCDNGLNPNFNFVTCKDKKGQIDFERFRNVFKFSASHWPRSRPRTHLIGWGPSVSFCKRVWALILDERRIKIKNVQMIMTLAIRTFFVLSSVVEKIPNIVLLWNMQKNLLENLIWHQKKDFSTIIPNTGMLNLFFHHFCPFFRAFLNVLLQWFQQ